MSIQTGRLVCPKCKNMNMFFISHADGFLRCFNSFKCIKNNGNNIYNFAFSIDDKTTEFPDNGNKTEEECAQSFVNWVCPNAGFSGNFFIHTKGCGFSSKNFLDFIPKFYEDKDFTNKHLIAATNYGKVYSAYSTKDNAEVCLKYIDTELMELDYKKNNLKDYKNDLINEIIILTAFSDYENSVKFYGTFDNEKYKVIVTERCDLDLRQFAQKKGRSFKTEEIKQNFLSINKIFKLLQEKLVIHRDLKLENFLVKYKNTEKTEYVIKLSDYGISKFKNNTNGIFSGIKGSEDTIAPEISLEKITKYESVVDVFSLGIIFYQLTHGLNHPFGKNFNKCYINYERHYDNDDLDVPFDESIKDENFKDLLRKMLKINPNNRISWENYFNHPFFN
jgi:serine/threonine protein kinase